MDILTSSDGVVGAVVVLVFDPHERTHARALTGVVRVAMNPSSLSLCHALSACVLSPSGR